MDQIQPVPSMPHIVQVYQPSVSSTKIQNPQIIHISHPTLTTSQPTKITYQQTVTSGSLTIPVSDVESRLQNQIVMSCQQTHLQNMQPVTMQSQILQSDVPVQFTSHMLLPHVPLFKQSMVVDESQQYYGQYGAYIKEGFIAKAEPELTASDKQTECELETPNEIVEVQQKRSRNRVPDPSSWACNVRKTKHQSGEAYINKRGKYVPERQIKSTKNCLTMCKLKCNKKISDADRELIFKAFYSLSANEKKHFLLNTTERHEAKHCKMDTNPKRQYTYKYFFLIRGTRHTVCKDFYLGTLSISQKPVYNVHAGKSEMNIPKPDGRGLSAASIHGVPASEKDTVRKHIMSFKTVDSTPIKQFSRKKQYIAHDLSIKHMYTMYVDDCCNKNVFAVRESMYRKILKEEFNINFFKPKNEQLCAKCREPIKKKSE
ncbi:uncharacterized protein LOC126373153 [Pectinophora gossypiella]|uniref:uncharacterized protein LOC126373153 n=1 Tax=Pectinophora gossypiella TaxID=13191 RepID=UPI00214EB69F|nr:uncharacterized protein LOC126373153 [Pectinophora gossypiella]